MTLHPVFTCTLAPEGRRFSTDGTRSLLDDALAEGVAVPFSCRRGECGSCRAEVVDGRHERLAPPTEVSYPVADGELLMCQCRATGDLTLRFPHWHAPAWPAARHDARIVSLSHLTADVARLVMEVPGGERFDALPGQHAQMHWDGGAPRCFSIAASTSGEAGTELEFHIRRVPGGAFTDHHLGRLRPGASLTIDGPHGSCTWSPPDPGGARHLVLLATGTGFAGVRAILVAALQARDIDTMTLYWGCRQPGDAYAASELDLWADRHPGFRWVLVTSADGQRVQDAAAGGGHDWARTRVLACGDPGMVRDARERLAAAGLPAGHFQSEAFLPAAPVVPRHPWEQVGPAFSLEGIVAARRRSIEAVRQIAAMVVPGMRTGEAIALADSHLRSMGSSCNWHPTYIRFGPDTQCTSRQPVDRQRRLRDDDLFIIDIGPVWDGHEGDHGDTFVLGGGAAHQRCAQAAREVFEHARRAWQRGLTGQALYDAADAHARQLGVDLVRDTAGHRVADFPHALYGKHRLAEADFIPGEGIWVLEIQVRDPGRPIGAFFEDVLWTLPSS